MRTIKLVIIGDSGVGKTSLRNNYVSGRFSTGYRATIGTDFITKALQHHSNPEEFITLQIWDTAGQERFSSLSTAFFRGADAVIMMYDVNKPQTLLGLKKWWDEFRERAPVSDEDAQDYCCVVVGNKVDLAEVLEDCRNMVISEEEARLFLGQLIPSTSYISPAGSPSAVPNRMSPRREGPVSPLVSAETPSFRQDSHDVMSLADDQQEGFRRPSQEIDIRTPGRARQSLSRNTSRSRFGGTMTTTHTSVSIYHTPSSSFFEEWVSAPSSPIPSAFTSRTNLSPAGSRRRARTSTTSSSDTITPSLFGRPPSISTTPTPIPLDRGPRLFFTSAKSGESVRAVFEYIAKRVVSRWELEESIQDRRFDFIERPSETRTVRLSPSSNKTRTWENTCCS